MAVKRVTSSKRDREKAKQSKREEKQKRKEEKLNNIKKQQVDIIRICLENIKLILQKENIKNYFETPLFL